MGAAQLIRRVRACLGRWAPAGSRRRAVLAHLYTVLDRIRHGSPHGKYPPRPKSVSPLYDPFDATTLAPFLARHRVRLPDGVSSPLDKDNAPRAILSVLLSRPDLRQRFPLSLREGGTGPFANWLRSDEARQQGIRLHDAVVMIETLATKAGLRVLHWYDHEPKAKLQFPLALTPEEATLFLDWALKPPVPQLLNVSADDVLWFFFATAQDPACGLADTFVRQPLWQQRVPHGLTRFGWDDLKAWVAKQYRVRGDWLARAERPDILSPTEELYWLTVARPEWRQRYPDVLTNPATALAFARQLYRQGEIDDAWLRRLEMSPLRLGVNLLAHFRYPSGLQVAAINTAEALELVGTDVSRRDVPTGIPTDLPGRSESLGLHPHAVTLALLAPEPLAADCYPRAGLAARPDSYRIGYWYWELEQVPRRWRRHRRWLHELWAPTRFIGDALRRAMPMPVIDMLAGMRMPPVIQTPRSTFGLPEDRFLFLFVFDMCSTFERKNPLAVIEAFRRAFTPRDPVALAIKVSRGYHDPGAQKTLREACEQQGVRLIDEVLSHEQLFGLINCCDAYVSLHRSEGYGLTMAEAMALGKPVIATGYSGNVDFMNENNSLLVGYKLAPLRTTVHVYRKGWLWAEPSVDQAAEWMRWIVDHPAEARALGERARRDVRETLSLEAAGQRMTRRIEELIRQGGLRAAG